jgi:hypothetical protein
MNNGSELQTTQRCTVGVIGGFRCRMCVFNSYVRAYLLFTHSLSYLFLTRNLALILKCYLMTIRTQSYDLPGYYIRTRTENKPSLLPSHTSVAVTITVTVTVLPLAVLWSLPCIYGTCTTGAGCRSRCRHRCWAQVQRQASAGCRYWLGAAAGVA